MRRGQEHRGMEIDHEVLTAYAGVFINRWDCYPFQQPDGKYAKVPRPLTSDLIEHHIRGTLTIGTYALDAESRSKWICLDADEEHEWAGLITLAGDLEQQGITAYLEQSRRGGHLWLFTEPVSGTDARLFARSLLASAGLEEIEIYPKQDELRTGPGSLVRLPLGFHRKTTPPHRFTFKTTAGDDLAPTVREQLAILAQPQRVSAEYIREAVAHLPRPAPVFPTPSFRRGQVINLDQPVSERIKAALSVREFVERYVDLDRSGRGLCPFHDDHRQSLSVSEQGNYWHCFAGCEGQTIIDFYMKWQGIDFKQAVSELAQLLLPKLL